MKKLLAILLSVCLLCGVFAVGAGASGDPLDILRPVWARNDALRSAYLSFSDWYSATPFYNEWKDSFLSGKEIDDFNDVYSVAAQENLVAIVNNDWSDKERYYEEEVAICHALLVEYFNSDLIKKFEAWRDACVSFNLAESDLMHVLYVYPPNPSGEGLVVEINPEFADEYLAFSNLKYETYNVPLSNKEFTFAQATAKIKELEAEVRALINKINGVEIEAAPTFFAKVWNFLLKWLFFGFLWNR